MRATFQRGAAGVLLASGDKRLKEKERQQQHKIPMEIFISLSWAGVSNSLAGDTSVDYEPGWNYAFSSLFTSREQQQQNMERKKERRPVSSITHKSYQVVLLINSLLNSIQYVHLIIFSFEYVLKKKREKKCGRKASQISQTLRRFNCILFCFMERIFSWIGSGKRMRVLWADCYRKKKSRWPVLADVFHTKKRR